MFKYIYIVFAVWAFFNKVFVTKWIHRIDKIKGKVYGRKITKLIYLFYPVPFIFSPVEFFLVERNINYYLSAFAFLAYISAWILSIKSIKTMGKYWTVDVEMRENHPLIKKGPYKYMRHPHYLFTFIELLGLPLIANAYYTFIVTAIIFIPLYTARITIEEKQMINKFGDKYRRYKKQVWGLFPIPIFKPGVKNEQ
ncbi:MAG: methyltransferase family protein [Elusimicrobiota bacterium]